MKTYKDIYKFPLYQETGDNWVRDAISQFVFQFESDDKIIESQILRILNGESTPKSPYNVVHEDGLIFYKETGEPLILIRGWGNLTGIGAHNLPPEEAANIQDTFAEFIVNKLNAV